MLGLALFSVRLLLTPGSVPGQTFADKRRFLWVLWQPERLGHGPPLGNLPRLKTEAIWYFQRYQKPCLPTHLGKVGYHPAFSLLSPLEP